MDDITLELMVLQMRAELTIYNVILPRILGEIGAAGAARAQEALRGLAEDRLMVAGTDDQRKREAEFAIRLAGRIEESLALSGYRKPD